jgi:hypothetical protein
MLLESARMWIWGREPYARGREEQSLLWRGTSDLGTSDLGRAGSTGIEQLRPNKNRWFWARHLPERLERVRNANVEVMA